MKQYWISAIIQGKNDERAWMFKCPDSDKSLEEALEHIEIYKRDFTVLSAWIDVFNENNTKETVFHECYIDIYGNVI